MEQEELNNQVAEQNMKTGFGAGANMTFTDYQKWLADMRQGEQQDESQALSDARTKGFVTRGFGSDSILRKMIGIKMMNNGMIDNNLLGYFMYRS